MKSDIPYVQARLDRHGDAARRLLKELRTGGGEFANHGPYSAVSFDAADFVWAFLLEAGYDGVKDTRDIRNRLADVVMSVLIHYNETGKLAPKT